MEVPDDARELVRDEAALARERRAAQRADRRGRLLRRLLSGSGSSVGVPALAVLAVLALVAVPAVLFVVLRPAFDPDLPARPLASPAVPAGQVGGLLPEVELRDGAGDPLSSRDVARPGALLLVPADCGCDELVGDVVRQAREFTRNVRLVVPGTSRREADRLRTEATGGVARSAVDPAGVLARTYGGGLTVVGLAPDGVVLVVLPDVQPGSRLEADLRVLRP